MDNLFFIPFNKGGGTVIDYEDMPLATAFTWFQMKGYANANVPLGNKQRRKVPLHRIIIYNMVCGEV